MLRQQVIGVITISFYVIALFYAFPLFFATQLGIITSSLLVGVYVWYLNYQVTRNQQKALQFKPSGEAKDYFDALIKDCGLNPSDLQLHYAYSNNALALTMFNTVLIDPLLWKYVPQDQQADNAHAVIEQHILPHVSPLQKKAFHDIGEIFSSDVQRFIFRHELGHVVDNYTYKYLVIMGIQSFIAAYAGISVALYLRPWGFAAVLAGMVVGGMLDIVLSLVYNVTYKFYKEKAADYFAAIHSTDDELRSAADFFEKHQTIDVQCGQQLGCMERLPMEWRSGHQSGDARARFLRGLIQSR